MDVAVIGISCRFPGANDHHMFWTNLVDRKASISVVPANRWDWEAHWGDAPAQANKSLSKWGGFIDRVDTFDNQFFGVLPTVAQSMDPQQRIMLELAWSCLEDAGIPPSQLRGRKIGVLLGVFNHDYKELQERADLPIEAHHSTGTATAIIANRVSHFFDFRGPSMPIDTACSSSLNAIHSAIQAMESGDCEMALAGGISLMLTPTRHVAFSKMGMLSPTGTCKTFDDSADGYVRGEGAGLLLLKPLDKALADGDPIYGVIKGSAVNHCGKTYTLTYPSPQAQAEVIVAAHERARIPVASVGFIEAHGTGTPKGDPIEFEGLLTAFRSLADKQNTRLDNAFCAVSSVKTNIGHLEAAAGVAGAIKVLMALRHRTMPALHDFKTLNAKIAIDGTPFYMLAETRAWQPAQKDQPRRAGISSFGFGGTNAHVIIEEAPPAPKRPRAKSTPAAHLIGLSAKTAEALRQRMADLLAWLHADAGQGDLADIGATLLLGREHFQHRFCCVAASAGELIDKLARAIAAAADAGASERVAPPSAAVHAGQELIGKLGARPGLKGEKYTVALQQLADLYAVGVDLPWASLFAQGGVKRVSLPTYPFSRDSFWLAQGEDQPQTSAVLHPALQRNVSRVGLQRYASTFTGKEFFLADHVVETRPVLPGVVYLEMVRAAIRDAMGSPGGAVHLTDVVWLRPLEVKDGPVSVHVELRPDAAHPGSVACLSFQVVGAALDAAAQVYCRGSVEIVSAAAPAAVDLAALESACAGALHDAGQCYRSLAAMGLHYGPAHQALQQLRSGTDQCSAALRLPAPLAAGSDAYVVHPSMADAALQAAVAFVAGVERSGASAATFLPFALDRLEVHAPCTARMHAWVRYAPGHGAGELSKKVDIDVIDADGSGRVCLAFRGLSIRPVAAGAPAAPALEARLAPALRNSLYTPAWVAQPVHGAAPGAHIEPHIEHLLLVGEAADTTWLAQQLRASVPFAATRIEQLHIGADAVPGDAGPLQARPGHLDDCKAAVAALAARGAKLDHVALLAPRAQHDSGDVDADSLDARVGVSAQQLFVLVKAMIPGTKRAKFLHLLPTAAQRPHYQGLSGFYKTLRIEKPSYLGRVVQCDVAGLPAQRLADLLASEFHDTGKECDVRYSGDLRSVRKFRQLDAHAWPPSVGADAQASPRQQGVYLITGGMGALGLLFARHLCARYRATVFLTGRSAAGEQQRVTLDELASLGGHAAYLRCDVASRDEVRAAIDSIHAAGHRLNGVIHSAGVIEDGFILRKSAESFARVAAPKTLGSWYLDLETRDEPLDFFALFSSVTGVLGNVGQCDYSFGNAFEDYFAHQRTALRQQGLRHGKTVAINWPYWKEGGMRLSDKEEEQLQRSFGLVPLLSEQGIELFEYALTVADSQLVVMPGDAARVREVLGVDATLIAAAPPTASVAPAMPAPAAAASHASVPVVVDASAAVARHLAGLFSSHLNISSDFELDRQFREYGFDSIVMIELVNLMENQFAHLPKTLFFEQQTMGELTAYLLEHHADACRAIAQPGAAAPSAAPAAVSDSASARLDGISPLPGAGAGAVADMAAAGGAPPRLADDDDIAIIGMSGRYPGAESLEQFWDNLKLGRDCVVEIPPERWDIGATFQPGAPVAGKSYSKWGGFLDGVDQFDPLFFRLSPKEAESMDPNERLFLETAALTIEDAGYTADKLVARQGVRDNPVGVYVGVMWGDYQLHGVDGPPTAGAPHAFYWAVANRVSHYFNFSGPSITLDTACSSSLTAIHVACAAIRAGEIGVALAGAVNLSLHPYKYNLLADMHFLSSDGRCRSFGEGGDGYVPGEGVGAVLLKPLSRARADGDHIYGIIRGSSVNHGGKAQGFTVPNSARQSALVQDAMQMAGVDPHHISYLEAHGTGTSLGDPIEIGGLSSAFGQQRLQYCAIGSVKSNIGHLEAAAGMAGLTKVLLQMKHRMLVPSILSDVLNPYIDFQKSPFYVQKTLQEWRRPLLEVQGQDGTMQRMEAPRLAGISSFGAGGSNAHLIVEEYLEPVRPGDGAQAASALIVLSAQKEAALRAMAGNLAAFVERNPDVSLQDAAYTLQTGRVGMEYRLAFVATHGAGLCAALRAYADGREDHAGLFTGHRGNAKGAPSAPPVADWIARHELAPLARAWVDGHIVAWDQLHAQQARKRLSLPGYVFQRQRYWIGKPPATAATAAALHPMIDANVSTLTEQTFRKRFHREEFFLRDHQIGGNRILPGVAYLEMAIAAGRLASPGEAVCGVSDMRWLKPIVVGEAAESVDIGLMQDDDGVHFEIYQGVDGERTVCGQGMLERALGAPTPARADLGAILARCQAQEPSAIAAAFEQMGFHFGPSFQVFDSLHFNANEALAKLSLPAQADAAVSYPFTLPPSLLDGAVRTVLGIGGLGAGLRGIHVPVRLGRIEVFGPLGASCHVHARRAGSGAAAPGQHLYDIDVLDASGQLLVRIAQFAVQAAPQLGMARAPARQAPAATASAAPAASAHAEANQDALRGVVIAHLTGLLAQVTKVPADQIDPKVELDQYGIDSVMILALTDKLQASFGDVPKTLFFEYQNLDALADYFLDSHADQVSALAAAAGHAAPPAAPVVELPAAAGHAVHAPTHAHIRARLFSALKDTLGDQARLCVETTPLAEWPIDPVGHARLLHALRRQFDAIDSQAIYRHATLDEWAAAIGGVAAPVAQPPQPAPGPVVSRFGRGAGKAHAELGDIAIIGLSGRYPGAANVDEFWSNLSRGVDGVGEIPLARWDHARHYDPDRNAKGQVYSKWGGFMDQVDQFDAAFFGMSPREAEITDPQERLFLQTAWECLEDACYTRQALKESEVGVFVGVMWGSYEFIEVSEAQRKYGRPMAMFASIANRVSYFLNLSGPSIALDTMCSSSLSAIHQACQAIRSGDCQMAIAGGVNLIVHPSKYHMLAQGQFLSSDGRCRAFGDGGDGYVPGEGVGAVLLKPLKQAIEDGDRIHGVIKASAVNHGGKTNGYTVPNQVAQSNVIGKALRRAGWHPASVSYIEAHGTGTSLGDPIEIAGLSNAFAGAARARGDEDGVAPQSCRIGSVKSNIGHLESAAGIAALTKVLMQLRHRRIAPSLHSSTLNSNIEFGKTPFRVVQALEEWNVGPARDGSGQPANRRAGISSFGAGGANAHVLIEEYAAHAMVPGTAPLAQPVLFVLSADGEERLGLYVDRVLAFLRQHGAVDLRALAYSSLVGREAMSERFAVLASSVDELVDALVQYRQGVVVSRAQRGSVRKHNEKLDAILDETQRDTMIRSLLQERRLAQLAKAWVSLLDIDWRRYAALLFAGEPGPSLRRMSFPTMPFLTRRHWVEQAPDAPDTIGQEALHALLDRNVSTLTQQRYLKRLTGQEFYLRDHIVDTGARRMILPGVAYLEMARAAGELAMGEGWAVQRISNLVWIAPVEVKGAPEEVTVTLEQVDDSVEWRIGRGASDEACAEGQLQYRRHDEPVADEWLDLAALRGLGVIEEDKAAIYATFLQMGFHYGSAYQVTETRHRMPGAALSRLVLPAALRQGAAGFYLHPSLFDGALRTCLAVGTAPLDATEPVVPFALGELELRHPLTGECYAYATETGLDDAQHGALAGSGLRKFDVTITDAEGRVLVKLLDFCARALIGNAPPKRRTLQYYGYDWLETPALPSAPSVAMERSVLVIAGDAALAEALSQRFGGSAQVVLAQAGAAFAEAGERRYRFDPAQAASYAQLIGHLAGSGQRPACIVHCLGDAVDGPQRGIWSMRHLFNALEQHMPGHAVRCVYAFEATREMAAPHHEAISGYARSLLTLNHRFELCTLRSEHLDAAALAATLHQELNAAAAPTGLEIAHWSGRRYLRSLQAADPSGTAREALPLKRRGAYLVTGGAGKLGLVLAAHLATRYQARLVLSGRSTEPGDAALAQIDALRAAGAEVHYRCCDVAQAGHAEALIAFTKQAYGAIDGILHCAGVASDLPITQLDDAAFADLLAPKIDGLLALDRASAAEPLDFFVNFSSVSALLGDLGSGAYAVANRFMDSHAVWRAAQARQGRRFGKSLSIGWPLWATGGMQISERDAALFAFSGMSALTEEEGIEAFEQLLRGNTPQVLVAVGDAARIGRTLRVQAAPQATAATAARAAAHMAPPEPVATLAVPLARSAPPASASGASDLQRRAEHYLKEHLALVVKVAASEIGADTTFEQLGMDSVMLMELRNSLTQDFPKLSKTALFEYDTPARMALYLMQQYPDALGACLGEAAAAPPAASVAPVASAPAPAQAAAAPGVRAAVPTAVPTAVRTALPLAGKRRSTAPGAAPVDDDAVAIIGLAGEFPQAANLAEFWSNLQQGKDCLSPIPEARWSPGAAGGSDSAGGYCNKGGFLNDAERFDPAFFGMSQTEAAKTDPQLRVLLRAAWHAIEDAAYTREALASQRVGVYIGAMNEDFTWIMAEWFARSGQYQGPGSLVSELANRISFLMNLRGPSLTVSTACSSSLTAVHLARQSILSGESDMALAGGVNLSLHPSKYLMLQDMKVLSPDGHERTFDDAGNGLVPSEGAGVVLLKRLNRALADGDQIHGVIRGSCISHAGTGAGQYLPNLKMLEETAARSLRESGVPTDDLSYIESHGTGTALGDPIELKALANALRQTSAAQGFCAIGTKANLGHMEAASGICSLIKVLLSMKHGRLSPCARLDVVNSSFEHALSPFHFPREQQAWTANRRGTRAAGINSFGMGGSNVFMVVESALPRPLAAVAGPGEPAIVVLSARSEERLRAYAGELRDFLAHADRAAWTGADFADLAYSSQIGRTAFDYRLAIVAADRADFIVKAGAYLQAGALAVRGVFAGSARAPGGLPELLAGEAGLDFIDALLQSRQWDKLASIWTRGCAIDWTRIHLDAGRRRLSFPAYPFETLLCDVRELAGAQAAPKGKGAAQPSRAVESLPDGAVEAGAQEMVKDWFRLDVTGDLAQQGEPSGAGHAHDGDDLARQYWLDLLQENADTSFLLAPALLAEYAGPAPVDDLPAYAVSGALGAELVQALQRCTHLHRIEVETLVAAAWAILMNRYTKGRCSQFGILKASIAPAGADSRAPLRNVVPVRITTVGREKIGPWLGALQHKLNRKRVYAHVPIDRIADWTGIENLFDSAIAFERSERPQAETMAAGAGGDALAPALDMPGLPAGVAIKLEVNIHSDGMALTLSYRSASAEADKIGTLLEHFQVLLEGLAAHPDKMPAALAMRTKRESRDTFWNTLDKVNR